MSYQSKREIPIYIKYTLYDSRIRTHAIIFQISEKTEREYRVTMKVIMSLGGEFYEGAKTE